MSTQYKHQEALAARLSNAFVAGHHVHVRSVIRTLKNKAQAAYIAASVLHMLPADTRAIFLQFIHPNLRGDPINENIPTP